MTEKIIIYHIKACDNQCYDEYNYHAKTEDEAIELALYHLCENDEEKRANIEIERNPQNEILNEPLSDYDGVIYIQIFDESGNQFCHIYKKEL